MKSNTQKDKQPCEQLMLERGKVMKPPGQFDKVDVWTVDEDVGADQSVRAAGSGHTPEVTRC